jgi:DNA-binding HxlR family transcriptional regulator
MHKNCTLYKTMDLLGKKWTLPILLELYKKNCLRYNQLKSCMNNITPKILSLRLKELEKEKLVSKKIDSTIVPIRCEYSLTESSKDFINIIQDIKKWGLKWKFSNKTCEHTSCKNCKL